MDCHSILSSYLYVTNFRLDLYYKTDKMLNK